MANLLPAELVEQLFACFDRGCSTHETARLTGTARNTAARYRHLWRRSRIRGSYVVDAGETLALRPAPATLAYVTAAATRRGVSRTDLVLELLDAIAEFALVDELLGELVGVRIARPLARGRP